MTAEPQSAQPGMVITAVDARHAEVTLTGHLSTRVLCDLEEWFDDLRLQRADHWVVDMRGVTRIELACAYALLRAVTAHSGTASIGGGRRPVLRTLRRVGLDKAAVIVE